MTNRGMIYSTIVVSFFLLLGFGECAGAEGMGYSVKAIIPDNQIEKTATYFDLKMIVGATQELTLELVSTSEGVLELMVEPHVATTNQNGELEYSVTPKTRDSSLVYSLTDLLSGKQSVTLSPKEKKQVTFRLTMPDRPFKGKLVGGFSIYEQKNKEEEPVAGQAEVQIRNTFSVVIGIQLRGQENTVKPELKLNAVKAGLFNYRTAILVNLQNTQPDFLGNVALMMEVKKKGASKSLYETEKVGLAFAPNSNVDFPISLENQELEPGSYEVGIEAKSGNQTWQLTKSFRITRDEAAEFNKEAVELQPTKNGHLILMTSLIGLFIAILLMTAGYLSSQRKERR